MVSRASSSRVSSSRRGSWWNSASRLAPDSCATRTAYSTVQWPHVLFRCELARRVLRVVDHEVGALAQLAGAGGDPVGAVRRLLVVGEVGDRHPVPGDPVAERGAAVGDQPGHDPGPTHRELVLQHVVEPDRARRGARASPGSTAGGGTRRRPRGRCVRPPALARTRRGARRRAAAGRRTAAPGRGPSGGGSAARSRRRGDRSASWRRSSAAPCRGRTRSAVGHRTAWTRTRCCRRTASSPRPNRASIRGLHGT